ncbi:MAG: NYN domain-containing protein [Verrucomicrobium sp.]
MPPNNSNATMAVYLDLENIVLGAQEARYPKVDIQKIMERLLLKGHIVTKKAYCDWERYKDFKRPLHEAAFELIEIPHVRQSGKNSADIRMVVDALDLCYTKGHVDTFVIISGDSDFSPLVSKLRENAKTVIGMGVKNSTSNLFITNCDEFIYYDDLVRKEQSRVARATREKEKDAPKDKDKDKGEKDKDAPKEKATVVKKLDPAEVIRRVAETLEALAEERDADDPVWGSMIKQALKRRDPGFNERAFGFRSFNALLEDAAKRGVLELEAHEKSGGYLVRIKG